MITSSLYDGVHSRDMIGGPFNTTYGETATVGSGPLSVDFDIARSINRNRYHDVPPVVRIGAPRQTHCVVHSLFSLI
jgi:hypothetical protein